MLRYALLGLVQGLTEFLPISSSAHLLFLRRWLGLAEPAPLLVAFLHLGTLLSLLFWFRHDLLWLLRAARPEGRESRRYLAFLVIALVPALILAISLRGGLDKLFSSPRLAAFLLVVTAAVLFAGPGLGRGRETPITGAKALVIGLAQAAATLPGLSRSGATVTVGLALGLGEKEAFRFSFLLGVPTFVGAALLALWEADGPANWPGLLLGAMVSFSFGLVALSVFRRFLRKLWLFGLYCLVLGIAGLIWG